MEVSQFTYFQQVAGFECNPVPGEITYGLERLAMYVQGVENVYDLNFNGGGNDKVTYGDVFLQAEQEYSRYNFEAADTTILFRHFTDAEAECKSPRTRPRRRQHTLPSWPTNRSSKPATTSTRRPRHLRHERQSYILRIRAGQSVARPAADSWRRA
jgi:glycyl-tRNA synthetase alpha chain